MRRRTLIAGGLAAGLATVARAEPGAPDAIAFDGPHQAGILDPAPAQATFAALDAIAVGRDDLAAALQALSYRARTLCAGTPAAAAPPEDPPPDSGVLGPVAAPDQLTITISFGHTLFDGRYGLAAQRPRQLTAMPRFANDAIDPSLAGGDVLIQLCAGQRDTVVHALRELLRATRGALVPRWTLDGFSGAERAPHGSRRNLFAFRDGTANPDTGDARLMDAIVWTGRDEPAWARGGTYQVVRVIRMHVEFWDRVGLREQETMIGRARDSGAPLGGRHEHDDPRFDLDPHGRRIPLDAHIRLANPRTPATADQRILRRGFNYARGLDPAASLDQGLIFVAYNQDPARQFARIQHRLDTEPMTDYITPVGGGYFFAPPGTGSRSGWVGAGLLS